MDNFCVLVIILIACVWTTGGLKCFQCVDPGPGGSCQHDYKTMVNVSQESFENGSMAYLKVCPNGSISTFTQDFCVTEVFYVGGILKSFIRDCSDGGNFSYTGDVDNPKLNQIAPDNFTTCIYRISANAHICVTLCTGDFCNGPIPPPSSNDTETCNSSDLNATCGAGHLFFGSSPFGPVVDRVLGRGYLVPLLVTLVCVNLF